MQVGVGWKKERALGMGGEGTMQRAGAGAGVLETVPAAICRSRSHERPGVEKIGVVPAQLVPHSSHVNRDCRMSQMKHACAFGAMLEGGGEETGGRGGCLRRQGQREQTRGASSVATGRRRY